MPGGRSVPVTRVHFLAVLAAPLALFAGCGTSPGPNNFDRRMAAYIGRSEADVVTSLGAPTRTVRVRGRRRLTYERTAPTTSPAFAQGTGTSFGASTRGWGRRGKMSNGSGLGHGSYSVVPTATCAVTFDLEGSRVSSFERRGEGCVTAPGF